jgi:hypothetical protein
MRNAISLTVSAFGIIAGFAGIEHGIGELAQGNEPPNGVLFESWPDSELFAILDGEPAMTVVPNLLLTGIFAVLVSLAVLLLVTLFIQHRHGGATLILLSVIWLLVGGGFGPPLLGIVLGLTATRIGRPLVWWRTHLPGSWQRVLSALWPWSLATGLAAWLLLMPGTILLNVLFGVESDALVAVITFSAFGLLLTTIITAIAREIPEWTGVHEAPMMARPFVR